MATGGAQPLIHGFDQASDFYVPFSYGRLVLRKGFTRKLYSHVKLRDTKAQGLAVFDVTIADENGDVAAEISDFIMKRITHFALDAAPQENGEVPASSSAASLATEVLRHGIAPKEGIKAFERIVACSVAPQIIVSPVDIHFWIKQADAAAEPKPATTPKESAPKKSMPGAAAPSRDAGSGSDSIEQRLTELYCQLLGVENVGPQDDFFELGGHSLLAVRLLTRIEKEFKKAITLAELFQAPTIEQLAAILRGTTAPKRKEFSVIVPFNELGKGPAFYCVHPLDGQVAIFRHLARLLGPEQRFYGIQAPPDSRTAEFAASIESLARHYLEALLAFQPEGPYLLGGWSAGATIALEMAQQLQAGGRQVELLVALDGAPFNSGAATSRWNPRRYWKLARNFPLWFIDDFMPTFSLSGLAHRVRARVVWLSKAAVAVLRGQGTVHADVDRFVDTTAYSVNQTNFITALTNALYTYVPKPYAGRVLLYKSRTESLLDLWEVEEIWWKLASQVDLVEVPGTHVTIVQEPHLNPIADDLHKRLAQLHTATEQGA
jgi:thioesterase domain-containing protein/acyl carrier protein